MRTTPSTLLNVPADTNPSFVVVATNGLLKPKVQILGVDLSGTVESVGRSVTKFAPGDQVFGSRGDKFGAHAEYACVAEDGFLARKPTNMSLEEAATLLAETFPTGAGGCPSELHIVVERDADRELVEAIVRRIA